MYTIGCRMFLFILWMNFVKASIVNTPSLQESFKQCLVSQPQSTIGYCFGMGAINRLQTWDSNPEFDVIDGVTLTKDLTQEFRDVYNYADQDPSNFRSIMDTIDHVFSRRSMRWDMSFIYPGLMMQVAPSLSPTGVIEFVLDPNSEALNRHRVKEFGTGTILARQFLVPLMLGTKFSMASILPIIFGILILLAKKALVVSKLALIASSAFGLGSMLFNYGGCNNNHPTFSENYYHGGQYHPSNYGGHYDNRFKEYNDVVYRGMTNLQEEPALHFDDNHDAYDRDQAEKRNGRNFAWNEDEKIKKAS
ncbi:uncharacterized protein LOC132703877 [Cylas formicarius]|uniref:uncharacterized protein LOC132703877 n=1 Tax=Cylas formicarius TaxID=197179 RepID=UPI0029584A2A|nr:uncharacterized protein LOC132703877 [Cylas formicarius]